MNTYALVLCVVVGMIIVVGMCYTFVRMVHAMLWGDRAVRVHGIHMIECGSCYVVRHPHTQCECH